MIQLDLSTESTRLEGLGSRLAAVGGVLAVIGVGGALAVASMSEHGYERLLETYLVSFVFFLSISLGALFFVLLQHLTRAGWSVVVRRLAEGLAWNLQLMLVLSVPIVMGIHHLYHWSHADAVAHDPLLQGKSGFLNPTFFIVRMAVYFLIWIVLARTFYSGSVRQDGSGDPGITRRLEKLSAPAMVLFALSLNFAAFDLLMSLDPHWFSTMFGVYYFAGSVVGFFAVMVVLLVMLQRMGRLRYVVTIEHYHDLGKFLFAFVVFWAYIAFSQYMLIWYANLPEETGWYLRRQSGDWLWVSLVLLFGHFIVPFLALISRVPKRRPLLLAAAATWMLIMHWIDLYWLAMPELGPRTVRFGALDVLCAIGVAGLYVLGLVVALRRHALLPEKDPRLGESLAFENA